MIPRRVVTGHDEHGRSVFTSDGEPPLVRTRPTARCSTRSGPPTPPRPRSPPPSLTPPSARSRSLRPRTAPRSGSMSSRLASSPPPTAPSPSTTASCWTARSCWCLTTAPRRSCAPATSSSSAAPRTAGRTAPANPRAWRSSWSTARSPPICAPRSAKSPCCTTRLSLALDGKTVVITGAARGQGAAEAELLVRAGALVIGTDVLEAEGTVLQDHLAENFPGLFEYRQLDVSRPSDWTDLAAELNRRNISVHGLVNNAGIPTAPACSKSTSPAGNAPSPSTSPAPCSAFGRWSRLCRPAARSSTSARLPG